MASVETQSDLTPSRLASQGSLYCNSNQRRSVRSKAVATNLARRCLYRYSTATSQSKRFTRQIRRILKIPKKGQDVPPNFRRGIGLRHRNLDCSSAQLCFTSAQCPFPELWVAGNGQLDHDGGRSLARVTCLIVPQLLRHVTLYSHGGQPRRPGRLTFLLKYSEQLLLVDLSKHGVKRT